MKNAIYIIGAGPLGIKAIGWAKELGLSVIVSDRNKTAPGIARADQYVNADAADIVTHLEAIKQLTGTYNIVGAYCGNEIGLYSICKINNHLGHVTNSSKTLSIVLDKGSMKKQWEKDNIKTPKHIYADSWQKLQKKLGLLTKKAVIKPVFGSGSRGVQIIDIQTDLAAAFNTALQAVGKEGAVLAEEYLEGRSIDANGVFMGGKFFRAGVLEKFITEAPDCLPLGGNDPAEISEKEINEVYYLLENSCRSLGLTVGPVKGDFIRTANGYYVLEVAPRFHGDVTTCNLLPYGSRINPLKGLFNYWLNNSVEQKYFCSTGPGFAIWRVLCLPPGKIKNAITNIVEEKQNITTVWYNQKIKNLIVPYNNTALIPGYICSYGDNKKGAENALKRFFANNNFEIDLEKKHFAWYKALGTHIKKLGFSKQSYGYKHSY